MKKYFIFVSMLLFLSCVSCKERNRIVDGHSVAITPNKNILIAGNSYSTSNQSFLICMALDGELLWRKDFDFIGEDYSIIKIFLKEKSVDLFLQAESKLYLINTDYTGHILSKIDFNSCYVNRPECIVQSSNGNYFIAYLNQHGKLSITEMTEEGVDVQNISTNLRGLAFMLTHIGSKFVISGDFLDDKQYSKVKDVAQFFEVLEVDEQILLLKQKGNKNKIDFINGIKDDELLISYNGEMLILDNLLNLVSQSNTAEFKEQKFQAINTKSLIFDTNKILSLSNKKILLQNSSEFWDGKADKKDKCVILDVAIEDGKCLYMVGFRFIDKIETFHRYGYVTHLLVFKTSLNGDIYWEKEFDSSFREVLN